MRSAHRLMLVNISMTFHKDILNGFQDTELQSGWHSVLGIFHKRSYANRAIIGILHKSLSRGTMSCAIYSLSAD